MKRKSINKILTSVLSLSMLMGSALPVLAAEGGEVDVEAPIYSLDVINVIVPTTFAVAFNPEGWPVNTGGSSPSTDQILSKSYGIINKSSKDKVITVKLTVEDLNGTGDIIFVNSAQDVTDAEEGEYKIHLTAIPAVNDDEVKVGTASASPSTTAADLNDVVMKKAAEGKEVTLMGGENYIGFKLASAVWETIEDSDVTLGETNGNDISENFEVTALADEGAGVTAFTFGGTMNADAEWSKLTKGIKISAVYGIEKASSDLTAIDGTGAMVQLNIAPTFATGKGIGQIKYSRGTGDDGLKEIKKIDIVNGTTAFDGYNALAGTWPAATDASGVITLSSEFLSYYSGDILETTVTYETNSEETKTTTVDVKLVITDEAPTFTTGAGVGQINYTMGAGDEGLKEIKKIEMSLSGTAFDGYNANGSSWPAATDASGVITLSSEFMTYWNDQTTTEATVTYETNGGATRTVSLDVKCQ